MEVFSYSIQLAPGSVLVNKIWVINKVLKSNRKTFCRFPQTKRIVCRPSLGANLGSVSPRLWIWPEWSSLSILTESRSEKGRARRQKIPTGKVVSHLLHVCLPFCRNYVLPSPPHNSILTVIQSTGWTALSSHRTWFTVYLQSALTKGIVRMASIKPLPPLISFGGAPCTSRELNSLFGGSPITTTKTVIG